MRKIKLLSLVLLVTMLTAGAVPLLSAQDEITLTVAMPDFLESQIRPDLFQRFEAEHPGVKVLTAGGGAYPYFTSPAFAGLDVHFEEIEQYVSSADVLFVVAQGLTVEATRAGYFLDLAPLASSDPALNVEDFHPAAWQSFEWDEGVWALPSMVDLITLHYIPEAFDEANLTYPNSGWTMDDLLAAARTLAQYNADGSVEVPGFEVISGLTLLFYGLAGEGFYDSSAYPEIPDLDKPVFVELLRAWAAYQGESPPSMDPALIPMRIEPSYGLSSLYAQGAEVQGALLPGGIAGLDVTGYAVSAGTLHPELAYELAKYLTADAQMNNLTGWQPARQSLVGTGEADDESGSGLEFSPEATAFLEDALAHAVPVSELRYADYLVVALSRARGSGEDFDAALQQVEMEAIANLEAAAAHRETAVVMVEAPEPTPVLSPGETALRFALIGEIVYEEQRSRWSDLIDEFVAQDPQVGQIIFEDNYAVDSRMVDTLASDADCFILPYNAVSADLPDVLNLDPFLDADPNFDRGDVLAGALAQVSRDNKVWALPLTIHPEVLFYNAGAFEAAGVPLPVDGWTAEAFIDALHRLKPTPDDPAPFLAQPYGNYTLNLMAAFGGLPIDTRTEPSTLDFTGPETVEAIRQVLDLARGGYIAYQAQSIFAESRGRLVGGDERAAILADTLQDEFVPPGMGGRENPYLPTIYPQGSSFSMASYQLKTAYISAGAANPEACYRWLSFVSAQPNLISGMPARRSMLNDPTLAAVLGEEKISFYQRYDAYLSDPTTGVLSFSGGVFENFFERHWLYDVFDRYVLKGADLDAGLAEAKALVAAYRQCTETIAPHDPAVMPAQEYYDQYKECAFKVDPRLVPIFGMSAEGE